MYRMCSLMLLLLLCLFTWLIVSLTYRLLECAFHSSHYLMNCEITWWRSIRVSFPLLRASTRLSEFGGIRCRRLMACWTSIGETSEKRYSKCAVIKQLEKSICRIGTSERWTGVFCMPTAAGSRLCDGTQWRFVMVVWTQCASYAMTSVIEYYCIIELYLLPYVWLCVCC